MSLTADEALHHFDENTAGMSPQRLNARGRTAGTADHPLKSLSPTFPAPGVRCIKEGDSTLKVNRPMLAIHIIRNGSLKLELNTFTTRILMRQVVIIEQSTALILMVLFS